MKIDDTKELEERVERYFSECAKNSDQPRLCDLAKYLGLDQSLLIADEDGQYVVDVPESLLRAKIRIEARTMELALLGVNTEDAMKDLVEYHGYTE